MWPFRIRILQTSYFCFELDMTFWTDWPPADLLGLLKWKADPDRINTHLEKLMRLDGTEVVKVRNTCLYVRIPSNMAPIKNMYHMLHRDFREYCKILKIYLFVKYTCTSQNCCDWKWDINTLSKARNILVPCPLGLTK